jgi:hypothetical protein
MVLSKEHIARVISALILIPIVLFFTLWSNPLPFAVALYFIILLASYEMIALAKKGGGGDISLHRVVRGRDNTPSLSVQGDLGDALRRCSCRDNLFFVPF